MESFEQYPDLHYATLDFKKSIRLTHGIDQQKDYLWGTAELVSWISLDGRKLEGWCTSLPILIRPRNTR